MFQPRFLAISMELENLIVVFIDEKLATILKMAKKLWPKHVVAIIKNSTNVVQQIGNKYCIGIF